MTLRPFLLTALGLACCGILLGQTSDVPARFEVASVKAGQSPAGMRAQLRGFGRISGGPGTSTPGQFTATGISLKNLLFRDAYQFKEFQYDAPSWMEKEIYDVVAKVPPGITRDQFRVMLQNLCIERFKIEYHHEQRDATIYDLAIAKSGLKMKRSKFDENTPPQPGPGSGGSVHLERDADGFPAIPESFGPMTLGTGANGQSVYLTNRTSIKQLIDFLSRNFNFPINDRTGLQGDFAFMLHFVRDGATAPARSGTAAVASDSPGAAAVDVDVAPTMFAALQNQLGLRLEPHKGPVDVLVVDKAEKTPIEN